MLRAWRRHYNKGAHRAHIYAEIGEIMAITNTYTINGGAGQPIDGGTVDIDMSNESGVRAGCDKFPIPVLNKITVTSGDGVLSKSTTIYAGYKIVQQMLGALVIAGNYNPEVPRLNTIISSGRFGIFEPAHYDTDLSRWNIHDLNSTRINSLINVGTGIKICVKIEYTKSNSSSATAYAAIPGASSSFTKRERIAVPYYDEIGRSYLASAEMVPAEEVESYASRSWFESILTYENLNINLSSSIVDPDTSKDITVTLMAYIGSTPTADNTFEIQPMNSSSKTSAVVQFETYNPTIQIINKDATNNPDTYTDGYGSVADYIAGDAIDTTINITISAPV